MRTVVGARSCVRARRALSLVLDHEGDAGERRVLSLHLDRCAACRAYARTVSAFTHELRSTRTGIASTPAHLRR